MTTARTVVLDNEAVQALTDPAHPKHRRVLPHVQVVAHRRGRGRGVVLRVPTAVRVEAGWDRTAPGSAFINRLGISDVCLDRAHADLAARLRGPDLSVADAHLGAVVRRDAAAELVVLTSDDADVRLAAGDRAVVVVHV